MELPLLNIANHKRKIHLFCRDIKGKQYIKEINDFFPFFFEPCNKEQSNAISYDNVPLKKIFVSEPSDVPKLRSSISYSSDILFTTNYLIHKIDSIIEAPIKICFLDIEVLTKELPDVTTAKYPISCITAYNSFSKELRSWYLGNYSSEIAMLNKFVDHMKKEKYDAVLSWNISFDYTYLFHRIPDFAKRISPIGLSRRGEGDVFYPAGISIIDYLKYFKKVYMREASYTLDYIAQKFLGEKAWHKTDFSKLSEDIRDKNRSDVNRMIRLEKQCKIIPYFDAIRRLCKVQWEDLYYNSRIAEMLFLDEAKKKNIILPNKPKKEEITSTFQGATRNVEETGLHRDIGVLDISSAYPKAIIGFSLDPSNITTDKENAIEINGIYFKQNPEALVPTTVKRILLLKDNLKKLKKENPDDKDISIRYDAIKGISNSFFGVFGYPGFRLYKQEIAATTAYLARDLLTYVKDTLKKERIKVIAFDTDGVFVNTKEDISDKLNQYVKDWAIQSYGKKDVDISFVYEGYFSSLFVIANCHYVGYKSDGTKVIKGVEIKRSSSSKYESAFQEALLNRILEGENEKTTLKWVSNERERIKSLALEEISFPCKIANKEYKNVPVFIRAYNNTRNIRKTFKVNKGEIFYYVYMINNDVLAFTSDNKRFIDKNRIDWKKMIGRNIVYKTEKIFDAMKWKLLDTNQLTLL